MNKEEYINSVVSHVKSKRNKQFISKEIGDHIDDGMQDLKQIKNILQSFPSDW